LAGNFAGMQSQIVCHGCRSLLLYPRGAPSVCCTVCHAVTSVPPPGNTSVLRFCAAELQKCVHCCMKEKRKDEVFIVMI
jgi:LSD1 subclass zinc finger protein